MADLITGFNTNVEIEHKVEQAKVSQYLSFQLSGKLYGISILDVDEILEPGKITELPMAPDYLHGVMNLRGAAVPVINLMARLGHDKGSIDKRSCIVLVEASSARGDTQTVGMLVDSVNEIVDIEQENILPPPDIGETVDSRFIQAMGRLDDNFIILLDINGLLSSEQVTRLGELAKIGLADSDEATAKPEP